MNAFMVINKALLKEKKKKLCKAHMMYVCYVCVSPIKIIQTLKMESVLCCHKMEQS